MLISFYVVVSLVCTLITLIIYCAYIIIFRVKIITCSGNIITFCRLIICAVVNSLYTAAYEDVFI